MKAVSDGCCQSEGTEAGPYKNMNFQISIKILVRPLWSSSVYGFSRFMLVQSGQMSGVHFPAQASVEKCHGKIKINLSSKLLKEHKLLL